MIVEPQKGWLRILHIRGVLMSYGRLLLHRATAWLGSAVVAAVMMTRPALADDLQVLVGAKLWANEWTSWTPVQTSTAPIDVIQSISSNSHVAVIPQISAFYDRWLVAASYFVGTDYSLGGDINPVTPGQLSALIATRKEADANLGYYIFPSLALTVGYKQIQQDFVHIANPEYYKWTGPTVGVTASAPLQGTPISMYGTFAYGRLGLHASSADFSTPPGHHYFNADYVLGELGVSYAIRTPLRGLSFSMTLGYRAQIVSTRKFDVATGFGGFQPVDLHDVTQGPAFSLLARF
jgi:hypothetical protein